MKPVIAIITLCMLTATVNAQGILGKIKDKAKQRADQKVDNAIDKGLDKTEGAAKKKDTNTDESVVTENNTVKEQAVTKSKLNDNIDYGSFDFIPGEKLLFEDEVINESLNEIPSLWIPTGGKIEVVKFDGANVIGFLNGDPSAFPRMKKYNYLPARFTIEYDFITKHNAGKTNSQAFGDGNGCGYTKVYFYSEDKDRPEGDFESSILVNADGNLVFRNFTGNYTKGTKEESGFPTDLADKWIHVSIAVTETNMKVYMNSQRILNVPVEGKAPSVMIQGVGTDYEQGFNTFVKNVRIAAGLKDPYKQGTSEIKNVFIARGIKFDYNKATIKPESMGELNYLTAMLKDNPAVKYEIGGHTDSDGDDTYNIKLSQQRADAVKAKLVEMGIDASRLTTKGYGETKPISENTTPDGKANNRRVEFVKK